jgi:hypothetical protein
MKIPFLEREALVRNGDEMAFFFFQKNGIELDFQVTNQIEYSIVKKQKMIIPEYTSLMNFIPETLFEKKFDLYENDGGINFSKIVKEPKEENEIETEYIHFNPLGEVNDVSENVKKLFHLRKQKKKIQFLEDLEEAPKSEKISIENEDSALDVIRPLIGLLLIHEGYEYADENAIQLLTEVVHEYFKKFTKNLNTFSALNTNRSFGFQSLLKCLHQIGVKDVSELKKFNESKTEATKRRLNKVEWYLNNRDEPSSVKDISDEIPEKKRKIFHDE